MPLEGRGEPKFEERARVQGPSNLAPSRAGDGEGDAC